jgi:hypothetical protein
MSLRGKHQRRGGNSHRPGGNTLERGRDALAKLKYDRRTGCVAPLRAPARWARPRPIFCPDLDANGPRRIVCIDEMRLEMP